MAEARSDANRLAALNAVLGQDVLLVNRFTATERISRLFSIELDLMAEINKAGAVKASALIGTPASIRLMTPTGEQRFFHGLFSRFQEGDEDRDFRFYRAELSPWLWLLTLSTDCRVFQDKTVPEMITDVFREHLQLDFLDMTERSYAKWDCCIQYRETCFNFVSRLMEHEGIFYFFRHEANKHVLVFADRLAGAYDQGSAPVIQFEQGTGTREGHRVMTSWSRSTLLTPGRLVTRDFHYGMPNKKLEFSEKTILPLDKNEALEVYDFPGEFTPPFNEKPRFGEVEQEGSRLTKIRMEEEEAAQAVFTGTSVFHLYEVGFKFLLIGHPTLSGTLVPLSLQHIVEQSASHFHGEAVVNPYQCTLTCAKFGAPFRPLRTTLRPVMQGPQTAIVTGPEGSEIHTDEFGRIKIHFHWDRKRDSLGFWVRVAQNWAGTRWGFQFIPRVGHEVLVDFIEGDPDQPIVIGSVYNAANQYPYELTKNQTQSGIKTRSTPKGEAGNFNEIRFEDRKGAELLVLHAERIKSESVEADSYESVGGNRTLDVEGNQVEEVAKIKANAVVEHRVEVVNQNFFLKIDGDRNESTAGNHVSEVTGQLHLIGTTGIVIESPLQISLVVGGNFVDINPAGVTIQGTLVNINSGGAPGVGVPRKTPSMYGDPELAKFDTEVKADDDPDPDAPSPRPNVAPNPNPLPPPPPPPIKGS
jgi:type VI secretion system secreted protein VgrG